MTILGFHASHEQLPPSRLLDAVKHAEQAGFDAAMCSDHLEPWSVRQGHSGYAWSWLAAALEATKLSLGVVTAPGQRYHPAIQAQKIATLAEMYPRRFWAAIGSGEAINEHVTGDPWPEKEERDARLVETIDVMRRLLRGEDGLGRRARPCRPRPHLEPPRRPAAPVRRRGEHRDRARRGGVGRWGHHRRPAARRDARVHGRLPRRRWPRADRACRCTSAGRRPTRRRSRSPTTSGVRASCPRTSRGNSTPPRRSTSARRMRRPSRSPRRSSSRPTPPATSSTSPSIADLGVDRIYLHHVGAEQHRFIDIFGERVLPALRSAGR